MPKLTADTSCRWCRIAVTTPKFPPPPRNAQNSCASLQSSVVTTRPSARTTSAPTVEREAEAADQRTITTAQGEAGHANGADRAGHSNQAERFRHAENVRDPRASGNLRRLVIKIGDHAVHSAQINHDAVAKGTTSPVVPPATYRQRKARGTGGCDC